MATYQQQPIPVPQEQAEDYARDKKIEPQLNKVDFEQWLKGEIQRADMADKSAELAMNRKWFKVESFYHNRQHVWFQNVGSESEQVYVTDVDSMEPEEQMRWLTNNQLRRDANGLIKEVAASNPTYIFGGRSEADEQEMASRFAEKIWIYYRDTVLGISYRLTIADLLVMSGNYFGKWSFNPKAGYRSHDITETQLIPKTLPNIHACPQCNTMVQAPEQQPEQEPDADDMQAAGAGGMPPNVPTYSDQSPTDDQGQQPDEQTGPPSLNMPCPRCGQSAQALPWIAGGQTVHVPQDVVTGTEPLGDWDFELIHPRNVKLDLTGRYNKGKVKDSPWLLYRYLTTREELEERYPYATIANTAPITEALLYEKDLQSATGFKDSMGMRSAEHAQYTHQVQGSDLYMDPAMYCRKVAENTVTIGTTVIQAGERIIDKYPDGIVICSSGGKLLEIRNECKNSTWSWGQAHVSKNQCYADGLCDDELDQQTALNWTNRFRLVNAGANAASQKIVKPEWMDPAQLEGNPERVAVLKENIGDEAVPASAVHQLMGTELTGAAELAAEIKEDMRELSTSSDEMGGDVDPHNRTASGQALAANNARSRLRPVLQVMTEFEIEVIYQCLEQAQAHYGDGSRYKGLIGKYGLKEEEAFVNCNIRDEIQIKFQPGSEMPRSIADEQQSAVTLSQFGGLPGGIFNPQVPPAIQEHVLKIFNQPFDINSIRPAKRLANQRLSKLRAAFLKNPKLAMMPAPPVDPMTGQTPKDPRTGQPQMSQQDKEFAIMTAQLAALAPIRANLDPHNLMVIEYQEWALTDEGLQASPLEQAVVGLWVAAHQQQANGPAMAAAQAAQQAKTSQIQTQGQVDAQNDQQKIMTQREADGQQSDTDTHNEIIAHAAKATIDVMKEREISKLPPRKTPPKK